MTSHLLMGATTNKRKRKGSAHQTVTGHVSPKDCGSGAYLFTSNVRSAHKLERKEKDSVLT